MNMSTYAQIVANVIENIIECDADFAATQGLVPLPEGAGVGWASTDGVTWNAPPIPVAVTNTAALQQAAQAALDNNITYLAVATPTAAQVEAQVGALTRQVDALIRLGLGLTDELTGT